MSFSLKNAGETYQCAMVTLCHVMIHKEVDVNVDDMISKSKIEDNNWDHLGSYFLSSESSSCG